MSQNVNGCLRRYGRYVYCLDFRQFAKSISQLKIIDCFTLYNQNGFIPIGYSRVAMDDIDTVILQGLRYSSPSHQMELLVIPMDHSTNTNMTHVYVAPLTTLSLISAKQ